ncbi:hypothetical protein ABZ260_47285 [Streptosporangium sp. NPDC006013]|uniref:hypothetical protein n=1 Tax=Streptosporangium sp. NPDC006013 TaxID=3155596 RepID=UPI00339FA007
MFELAGDDMVRVMRVIEKIARALWAFEVGEVDPALRTTVRLTPVSVFEPDELQTFRDLAEPQLFPEVGSRMMSRIVLANSEALTNSWENVQEGRFAYAAQVFSSKGQVKMILSDFLAAEVDLEAVTC